MKRYCKICGHVMVRRYNRYTGETFLGCSNFPYCKHTYPPHFSIKRVYV